MPDNKNMIGTGGGLPGAQAGIEKGGSRAGEGVSTKWKDIKWTRNKLVGTTIALGLPYLLAIVLTWIAGVPIFTYVLIGVGMLTGFIFLVLGWIDSDEF